jgi:hypothetical protein
MRYLLAILFIYTSQLSLAQVPGFMGKRFTIFLDANPMPALFVQNINNTVTVNPGGDDARTDKVNRFAYNIRPQVTAEYLVAQRFAIGLSYHQMMVGTVRGYLPPEEENSSYPEYEKDPDVIRGQGVGIHFKFYHRTYSESIPPIGHYRTLSIYLTQSNTYDTKTSTTKQFKNEFVHPVATYSIGRQSMILKNVLFKTGIEMGFAFVPRNFIVEGKDEWTEQEYAGYNVHQSLAGYYFFNINLAIGFVAF